MLNVWRCHCEQTYEVNLSRKISTQCGRIRTHDLACKSDTLSGSTLFASILTSVNNISKYMQQRQLVLSFDVCVLAI